MQSTHTATLDLHDLPTPALTAHIFPKLASGSLLSIGQLCDYGCSAYFMRHSLLIFHKGKIILRGTRTDKLWNINTTKNNTGHSLNATIGNPTIAERIKFYHASLFSPTLTTLTKAINAGYLTTFPAFTAKQVNKYPPSLACTHKGHMKAQRQNLRSTQTHSASNLHKLHPQTIAPRPIPNIIEDDDSLEQQPSCNTPQPVTNKPTTCIVKQSPTPSSIQVPAALPTIQLPRSKHVFADCIPVSGKIYTDQTGQFSIPSSSGNKYLFVLYEYDSNFIHAVPIPSRTKHQLLTAYKSSIALFKRRGFTPLLQRLDNEASELLQEYMHDEKIDFQLTPAGTHRRNTAERAIQTLKDHIIAGLCSCDPKFPLHLWDKLLPQAIITLNLMRPSNLCPQLSAYAHVHGAFDYNRTPLAPPGIKVLAHILPDDRPSWSPHAIDGFYVGPAMQHYRCHNIWIPTTARTRIAETVRWFPHNYKMPSASREDTIIAAAKDLTAALLSKNHSTLLPPISSQTRTQLKHLASLFSPSIQDTPSRAIEPRVPTPIIPTPTVTNPTSPPIIVKIKHATTKPTIIAQIDNTSHSKEPRVIPTHTPPPMNRQTRRILTRTIAKNVILPTRRSNRTRIPNKKYSPTPELTGAINSVLHPITGKLQEYRHLRNGEDAAKWIDGCSKEVARLCNGRTKDNTKGTNTMFFCHPSSIPKGRKPTYLRIVSAFRPQKSDPYRIRWTVGGNLVDYPGIVYTPTADLTTAKILFNSIISTKNARFCNIDLKDFYLNTPMARYEYMLVPINMIPQDIFDEYKLKDLVSNGKVLVEIRKGMYGLPQAGRIAYEKLLTHLAKGGYIPTGITAGLFKHRTRPIQFCLVVDDFGVKYIHRRDCEDLITHLEKEYKTVTDWDGNTFCGIHLHWQYDHHPRTVTLSMPGYVEKALIRFNHTKPNVPQDSPHPWSPPKYGVKQQIAAPLSRVPLTPQQTRWVQELVGVFLYYARAIDNTMLASIGSIASSHSTSTWADIKYRALHFLNYAASHPNAAIRYTASQMQLWADSDASYLCESKARSRAGGYHFLSSKPSYPIRDSEFPPPHNAPIQVISKIIDTVMSSAQEAETGAGYINGKELVPSIRALEELGHKQFPVPIQFDNKVAAALMKDECKPKQSKSMDMRFYWLRCRQRQKQFHIYWRKGVDIINKRFNLGDYPTKHHPTSHHRDVRPNYVMNKIVHTPPTTLLHRVHTKQSKTPLRKLKNSSTAISRQLLRIRSNQIHHRLRHHKTKTSICRFAT